MNEVVEDIREIRSGMLELVKCSTETTTILKQHSTDLGELKTQIKTALIPVLFFKWSLVVFGGLSTVGGVVYGILKGVALAATLMNPPLPPHLG